MASHDDQEKTEDPTQQKLEKAREEGQIFLSKDLNLWFMFLCFAFCFSYWLPNLFFKLMVEGTNFLAFQTKNSQKILIQFFILLLSTCVFFPLASFLSGFIQTKGFFSPKTIIPKLERLSVKKGWRRIFSMENLEEFIKNLFKLIIFAFVIFFVVKSYLPEMNRWINFSLLDTVFLFKKISLNILNSILITFFVIAVLDFFWQKKNYIKKMRMSQQEIKQEYKEMEGDPKVKSEMRKRQYARRHLSKIISKATVVVVNPTHISVVLEWDENTMIAPKITAKGRDSMALHIREIAQENKIPIFSNPHLARSLYQDVKIDDFIPAECYKTVADIIRFVRGL